MSSIDLKNHTYYFFNDMINIKNFDPNRIKISLFITLGIFLSKTLAIQKLIV